jgi:hypothetical protein
VDGNLYFSKALHALSKETNFLLQKVALAMLLLLPLSYLLPQTSSIVFILAKSRRGVLFLGVLPILAKSIGGCYF